MRARRGWFRAAIVASILGVARGSGGADGPPLADYFRAEVARIAARPLAGVDSAGAWQAARPELQRQLREMLGLDPMPGRGDLHARVTGTVERPDFAIERLVYQSSPGLYVTANLYRPRRPEGRLPAILYVCGHGRVEKAGVIYGCKAHYQHHAAWFAANGYVCLVLDTLELGEVPGVHHGTYRLGMWWWQSRGYTPAGVEAWNALRGVDYLVSRPDVDPGRIGVTGRSGGGATSWWVGALDDRVAAVAPVAGITDLEDHVVGGVVEGHCDCMYPHNTYRWDFPTLAALVAPKPLLVGNTDADPIFPEGGVRRVFAGLGRVYGWYGAGDRLGLVMGRGKHLDTPEIRHPAFAFFERHLKGNPVPSTAIEEPARAVPIEELRVLGPGEVPPFARNATIHESFVAEAPAPAVPGTAEAWEALRSGWLAGLRSRVCAGWPGPGEEVPLDRSEAARRSDAGESVVAYDFTSQAGVRPRAWCRIAGPRSPGPIPWTLAVLDQAAWDGGLGEALAGLESGRPIDPSRLAEPWRGLLGRPGLGVALVAPRGVGPTAWPASKDAQVRRRFALLGQTLDGMRAWDVRRAVALLRALPESGGAAPSLIAAGPAAPVALLAAIFEPEVPEVTLLDPPATWRDAPALFGVERVLGVPQAATLLAPRPLTLVGTPPEPWAWAAEFGRKRSPGRPWPRLAGAPEPAAESPARPPATP